MNAPTSSQIVYLHAVFASHGQEGGECLRFWHGELLVVGLLGALGEASGLIGYLFATYKPNKNDSN
jgi:hypothetical protein